MSDLKYALRAIRRNPGLAAVAVFSLALGIGANVTIYSIANAFLERPVPGVRRAQELVRVYRGQYSPLTAEEVAFLRARNSVFEGIAGERTLPVSLSTGDTPERARGAIVTAGYFDMLGVRAQLGRLFTLNDTVASNAVVISDAFWRRRFGADPGLVGTDVRINERVFTIVGVTQPEFTSSQALWTTDVWFPPAAAPVVIGEPLATWNGSMYVTARLRQGTSIAQANADVATLAARLVAADTAARRGFTLQVADARGVTAELRPVATAVSVFLLAVVGLVLLIACANVANLLLARAAGRRREISVRIALGASRRRLVRQLLTESAVLAAIAGVVGVLAAGWLADAIGQYVMSRAPEPLYVELSPDVRVVLFTVILSAATTLVFGLLPAMRATSPSIGLALREDAPQASGRSRTRSMLIGFQVALCTVLLACTTLFLRSLANARDIDPGFDASGIATVPLDVSMRMLDSARGNAFFNQVLERTRTLPGVRAAAIARISPLSGSNIQTGVWVEGRASVDGRLPFNPYMNAVGPGYFETLGIPLRQGRGFTDADVPGAPRAVIVNEQMARASWPDESPVGKRISFTSATGPWATVVGVANDTKYNSLGEEPPLFMYLPFAQGYRPAAVLHVRADPRSLDALRLALAKIVRDVDPLLPPPIVGTLEEDMRIVLLPAQLGAMLLGMFGTLALLLATIGIYGVASYSVAQRTREFGIRSALGATASDVVWLVVREGMRTVSIGAAVGILLALGAARVLTSQLYGVKPTDPVTFIAMPAFLLLVAIVATIIPARKAMRVQPGETLRVD